MFYYTFDSLFNATFERKARVCSNTETVFPMKFPFISHSVLFSAMPYVSPLSMAHKYVIFCITSQWKYVFQNKALYQWIFGSNLFFFLQFLKFLFNWFLHMNLWMTSLKIFSFFKFFLIFMNSTDFKKISEPIKLNSNYLNSTFNWC